MTALNRKMWRELWEMKSQALAIALVVASGVATFVMSLSTLHSLRLTQAEFYREARFAGVFASLQRAPERLRERIEAIPGVRVAETRVFANANLDIEGYPHPATALIVSLAEDGGNGLNQLYLREGRLPEPFRDDEVVVSEAFAEAHDLHPGDSLIAILNGREKRLSISGTALSPEFIYQIRPGALVPDFESYAILWMPRRPLAAAYDRDGAFNNLALALHAGAVVEDVIGRLDRLLEPYGGRGAYAREEQLSHRFLSEEFRQLETMATLYPVIFLSVAAFLLNVVFSRLIRTQREEIATLKAFGYSAAAVGWHYAKFVMVVTAAGVLLGIAGGVWLGQGLSQMYTEFYRFPYLHYELEGTVVLWALAISQAASLAGTLHSVRGAVMQPPAEAMRPEPPGRYRRALIERLGLGRLLSEPSRMIVRHLSRYRLKALMTATGMAFAFAILVMGMFFRDAIDYMIEVQFRLAQRDDILVTFTEPTSKRALFALQRIPGIDYAEPFRNVAVRLRHEHRSYRTAIEGLPAGGDLRRLLNEDLEIVEPPPEGLLLTDHLAKVLGARPGDLLTVEVLEGARPVLQAPLAGVTHQFMGVSAYMEIGALNRLMREGNAISGALLATDSARQHSVYERLKQMPRVAGTEVHERAIESLYETMAEQMLIFAGITTLLASTIAFGVVYNSARIALSERSRELASLRVLGFTRAEVSYILLGELAILTLLALPLGAGIGRLLSEVVTQNLQTDLFRIPLVLESRTYAYAGIVVMVCAMVSGLIVRRRIGRLDLVEVLKTRE